METKTYKHYGVDVLKQTLLNKQFISVLEENGIEYEMMPIEISGDVEVYIYTAADVKKYAVVYGAGGVDGFAEEVYITTAIPDDMDWQMLMQDVDQQQKGGEPLKMHTQFQRRLLSAETKVQDAHKYLQGNIENLVKAPDEYIPNYWHEVYYEILRYYNSEEEIKKYGYAAWDVMDMWVDKLLNDH